MPVQVQEHVRLGALSAHAAMKYLVPMARVDVAATERLAAAILPLKPTTREVATLYAGWQSGTQRTRELILSSPKVFLDAKAASGPAPPSARVARGACATAARERTARSVGGEMYPSQKCAVGFLSARTD